MADVFTREKRSDVMRAIRATNTKPELLVRKALHREGFRFRLHVKNLPGKPDIVLPRLRTAIQVRGCFWHGHDCADGHLPKSNRRYWTAKLTGNVARDTKNDTLLRHQGWHVTVIWECQASSASTIKRVLRMLHRRRTAMNEPSDDIIDYIASIQLRAQTGRNDQERALHRSRALDDLNRLLATERTGKSVHREGNIAAIERAIERLGSSIQSPQRAPPLRTAAIPKAKKRPAANTKGRR